MASQAALSTARLRVVRPNERSPAATKALAERRARRSVAILGLSVASLTALGLVMVLSASSVSAFAQYGSSFTFFKRQLVYAVLGSLLAAGTARLPYRVWQRAWVPLFGGTVLLLLMVLTKLGVQSGGASRWIQVGSFSMQPSELAKFVVVVAAASILAANLRHLDEPVLWLVPLGLVTGAVSLLIVFQRDLGTILIVGGSVFLVMFVAGVRARTLIASALGSGLIGFGLIMAEGYRRARLFSFLHPWKDAGNTGYQIVQSLVGLASGHWTGLGLGASRAKWGFLPNAYTDFIFAVIGEELGLLGTLLVIALFAAFAVLGVRAAIKAPDRFGALLAAGITAWVVGQALINIGAVIGVLPVTGVPLPFISFGGSSLVITMGAAGMLLNIARQGR